MLGLKLIHVSKRGYFRFSKRRLCIGKRSLWSERMLGYHFVLYVLFLIIIFMTSIYNIARINGLKWKLCSHWLRSLLQRQITVAIQSPDELYHQYRHDWLILVTACMQSSNLSINVIMTLQLWNNIYLSHQLPASVTVVVPIKMDQMISITYSYMYIYSICFKATKRKVLLLGFCECGKSPHPHPTPTEYVLSSNEICV